MSEKKTKPKVNEQEYQANYYKEHKDVIARRKKDRYRNDADYRKAIRERAKIAAAETRKQKARERLEYNKSFGGRTKDVFIDDKKITLFSSAAVAAYATVSAASIKNWVSSGILPEPTIQIGTNAWFSREYMEMVRNTMSNLGLISLGAKDHEEDVQIVMSANYNQIKDYEKWIKEKAKDGGDDE